MQRAFVAGVCSTVTYSFTHYPTLFAILSYNEPFFRWLRQGLYLKM